jgi:hypothetical protein
MRLSVLAQHRVLAAQGFDNGRCRPQIPCLAKPSPARPCQALPRPVAPGQASPSRAMPCPAEPCPAMPGRAEPRYFFASRRGRFQYGLLHFGQIVGVVVAIRATQTWLHRSHFHPSSLTLATGRDCRMPDCVLRTIPSRVYLLGRLRQQGDLASRAARDSTAPCLSAKTIVSVSGAGDTRRSSGGFDPDGNHRTGARLGVWYTDETWACPFGETNCQQGLPAFARGELRKGAESCGILPYVDQADSTRGRLQEIPPG